MTRNSPQEQRTDAARRMLEAAKRLFAERGYDGVSIRDIAEAAEVSKANVFHHYASKWALYQAVMEHCAADFSALLAEQPRADQGTAQVLACYTAAHLRCLLEDPDAARLFTRQLIDQADGEGRALAENLVAQNYQQALARIQELQADGRLRGDTDPALLALLLGGVNMAIFQLRNVLPRLAEHDPLEDPDAFAEGIVKLLIDGILPRE
ncbi:TetR/AcrR family transcriptional regulator [Alkalilimnicola sp. S0819]|uniref:TetR/AcrR family transcriptional regulator n=1 Tax=Alkalilimnicola sp. S0819 TaxID=2613922 RepID=UPI001261A887|nr:TetR/AcrR family transcriptional regulator [Alkalilimnicola sp. S0819]KAB7627822.1 TetR/AcrR family transcriptional regulator [Alkalilimnicola sp. S0819]MPQ15453.1 TetR family transcriptional regulator [Alkalilimnicola sp. S0819]